MTVAETQTNPLLATKARQAMHPGVIGVPPRATVREVAAVMAVRGIHAVAVAGSRPGQHAMLTDLALVGAILENDPATHRAEDVAAVVLPTVAPGDSLADVARVVVERRSGHARVADDRAAPAAGIVSAFDLVAVVGGHDPRASSGVRPAAARPALSEHRLDHVQVRDVMHPGIVSCPPATPTREVAATMAVHRVHCVAIGGVQRSGPSGGERLVWGLVDAMDVVASTLDWDPGRVAAEMARRDLILVEEDETVETAARLMVEHGLAHLVAVDGAGLPAGVISTVDVCAVCAVGAGA